MKYNLQRLDEGQPVEFREGGTRDRIRYNLQRLDEREAIQTEEHEYTIMR